MEWSEVCIIWDTSNLSIGTNIDTFCKLIIVASKVHLVTYDLILYFFLKVDND